MSHVVIQVNALVKFLLCIIWVFSMYLYIFISFSNDQYDALCYNELSCDVMKYQ